MPIPNRIVSTRLLVHGNALQSSTMQLLCQCVGDWQLPQKSAFECYEADQPDDSKTSRVLRRQRSVQQEPLVPETAIGPAETHPALVPP